MLAIESGIISLDLEDRGAWRSEVRRQVVFGAPFSAVPEVVVSFSEIEAPIAGAPGDGQLRLHAAVEARHEESFDLRVWAGGSSKVRMVTVSWIAYGERS